VTPRRNTGPNFQTRALGSLAARFGYAIVAVRVFFDAARLAMDQFEKKSFLPPIERMIVLALNAVVAILAYYVIMMWGFVQG
jgi:hypothetical protein